LDSHKHEPVVELDGAVGHWVVLEPHEVEVQDRRKRGEDDALLGILKKVEKIEKS
jgi:hypothetical protein